MATLYVENFPGDLYEGIRKRARENRRSIAAEVTMLLQMHVPPKEALKRRRQAIRQLELMRKKPPLTPGPFPSAEEMIREDRER